MLEGKNNRRGAKIRQKEFVRGKYCHGSGKFHFREGEEEVFGPLRRA
jgi:hypothetical protein